MTAYLLERRGGARQDSSPTAVLVNFVWHDRYFGGRSLYRVRGAFPGTHTHTRRLRRASRARHAPRDGPAAGRFLRRSSVKTRRAYRSVRATADLGRRQGAPPIEIVTRSQFRHSVTKCRPQSPPAPDFSWWRLPDSDRAQPLPPPRVSDAQGRRHHPGDIDACPAHRGGERPAWLRPPRSLLPPHRERHAQRRHRRAPQRFDGADE